MGDEVILSYLLGNALRTVITARCEGSSATADTTVNTGRADCGYHAPFGQILKGVHGYCPCMMSLTGPGRWADSGVAVRFPPVVVTAGWHCGMCEDEGDQGVRPR